MRRRRGGRPWPFRIEGEGQVRQVAVGLGVVERFAVPVVTEEEGLEDMGLTKALRNTEAQGLVSVPP
jgi:hypothetical protein